MDTTIVSRSQERGLRSGALNVLLTLISVIVLIPVFMMVTTSLKAEGETTFNPGLIPHQIDVLKFGKVWYVVDVPRLAVNSLIITIVTIVLVLLLGSMASYAFARINFVAREPLYFVFLLGLMIPGAAVIVPLYQLNVTYHLMNTYLAVIGPQVALSLPFSILLLRSFFQTLPREIEDAAFIDGASRFQVYWQILLPLTKPALTTVGIFVGLGAWNDFLFPLLYLTKTEMRTLPLGIIAFVTTLGQSQYEDQFALLVMMTLPVIIAFLFLQRYFVGGLTSGAVKI